MKARTLFVMEAALVSAVAGLTSSVVESSSPVTARVEGTEWSINAPIPEPLGVAQGATVASADGSLIYHIGGITGDMRASNRVWVYSTAADTWSKAAAIPVERGIRTFGAAVELNGFIYVFGGFDGKNILDSTWIYDETRDAWFQGASMPRFDIDETLYCSMRYYVEETRKTSRASESTRYSRAAELNNRG